jgi:TPR repeat protein
VVKSDLQLAHEYLFGFTRPQEVHKAIEIYQREASKSNPDPSVFNVLGVLHEQGKGFPKDMGKAFKYFMKAADKGDP